MLGVFHLLPLIKGWEYRHHTLSRTVNRGADPLEISIKETGWLMNVDLLSDDCYGTLILEYQGADLQTKSGSINAEAAKAIGATVQDPSGWVQKYFRPDPNSTFGIFYTAITNGYQGYSMPYVPVVKAKIYLPTSSTQTSATVIASCDTVAITDKKLFMQSLRKILDDNASLHIDPALLSIGPAPFEEEKIEEEKKQ